MSYQKSFGGSPSYGGGYGQRPSAYSDHDSLDDENSFGRSSRDSRDRRDSRTDTRRDSGNYGPGNRRTSSGRARGKRGDNNDPMVEWQFMQIKNKGPIYSFKSNSRPTHPTACFNHSVCQVGKKLVTYGGLNYSGESMDQIFLFDTVRNEWDSPKDVETQSGSQDELPGMRYAHNAVLVEMHPPKLMVYGGFIPGGSFQFDGPESAYDSDDSHGSGGLAGGSAKGNFKRTFINFWRKSGKQKTENEEMEDAVYFLTLNSDSWQWSKPALNTPSEQRPKPRGDFSMSKTGTNMVTVFGGYSFDDKVVNDCWHFDYQSMEWSEVFTSGIKPRPRYRHTSASIGKRLFIMGGSDNGADDPSRSSGLSFHVLNLDTLTWQPESACQLSGSSPFPRSGHSSCVVGSTTIAVFGGKFSEGEFLNDLVLIDTSTNVCTEVNCVPSLMPTPVISASLDIVGMKLYCFGGADVNGNTYNDIRMLDVSPYLGSKDLKLACGAASDYSFKILVIGDASVGKSAILGRFAEDVFRDDYASTIGIDYNSRQIRVDGSVCKLEIWDTAGQERFSTITATYYRGAQGCLLCYDITRRESFDHVRTWFERARQLGGEHMLPILVGNKADLEIERQVSTEEGRQLASELGIPFMETSALNGSGVEESFVTMTKGIKKSVDDRGLVGVRRKSMVKSGEIKLGKGDAQMTTQRKMGAMCCGGG